MAFINTFGATLEHLKISISNDNFTNKISISYDVVIKWKRFPRYWPFVRGIHRSPVNSPHKGQWRGALMFSLICAWINGWVNNREAGHRAHYDVTVMTRVYSRLWDEKCLVPLGQVIKHSSWIRKLLVQVPPRWDIVCLKEYDCFQRTPIHQLKINATVSTKNSISNQFSCL